MGLFGPPTKGPGTIRVRYCGLIRMKNGGVTGGVVTQSIKDKNNTNIVVKTPEEADEKFYANIKQLVDPNGNNIFKKGSSRVYSIRSITYTPTSADPKVFYYLIKLKSNEDSEDSDCNRGNFGGKKSKKHGKSRKHKKTRKHRRTRKH